MAALEEELLEKILRLDWIEDYDTPGDIRKFAGALAEHRRLETELEELPKRIALDGSCKLDGSEYGRILKLAKQAQKLERILDDIGTHRPTCFVLGEAEQMAILRPYPDDEVMARMHWPSVIGDLFRAAEFALIGLRKESKRGAPSKRLRDRLVRELGALVASEVFTGRSKRDEKLGRDVAKIVVELLSVIDVKMLQKRVENLLSDPRNS